MHLLKNKYVVGFLMFGVFYLIWRNLENKTAVGKLTNLGS
jgi:hypothetical protein